MTPDEIAEALVMFVVEEAKSKIDVDKAISIVSHRIQAAHDEALEEAAKEMDRLERIYIELCDDEMANAARIGAGKIRKLKGVDDARN